MKKMRSKKRYSFSLLEVMLSLAIITLITSLLGVRLLSLIADHRVKLSSQTLLDRMKELQVLSISHSMDSHIEITEKKGEVFFTCFNEADLVRGPLFSTHCLKGVKGICVNEDKKKHFKIQIFSDGRISPSCLLGFYTSKEDPKIWLDLRRSFLLSRHMEKPKELPTMGALSYSSDIQALVDK